MALGRQGAVQDALLIGWHEVPTAPGHVFYDRLNGLLDDAGFDREVEDLCASHYASGVGRPSVPPGRYFRMLFVGYFEGLDSERGIATRRTVLRWHGDDDARRAVYANRARLLSGVARVALLLRAVLCERAFAHVLDRGGMRRTWLRGRDNVAKRYRIQVAGHNLGLLMRALIGAGTPRAAGELRLLWLTADDHLVLVLIASPEPETSTQPAMIATITATPEDGALSTGC